MFKVWERVSKAFDEEAQRMQKGIQDQQALRQMSKNLYER